MLDRSAPLTRRSLFAAGLGGVAVVATGCDAVDDVLGSKDDPGVSGGTTPTAAASDADGTLVAEIGTAVATAGALASAVGTTVPALAGVARRLRRLHAAHAHRLRWSGNVDQPDVTANREAALRQLLQAEADLQTTLAGAAQRAESGALAQTFASMAAAVAQQRAVLG